MRCVNLQGTCNIPDFLIFLSLDIIYISFILFRMQNIVCTLGVISSLLIVVPYYSFYSKLQSVQSYAI